MEFTTIADCSFGTITALADILIKTRRGKILVASISTRPVLVKMSFTGKELRFEAQGENGDRVYTISDTKHHPSIPIARLHTLLLNS